MNFQLRGQHRFTLSILLIAWLTGCGTKPKLPELPPVLPIEKLIEKPMPQLTMRIAATADANRDPEGKPLAVVVRVYELKSHGVFTKADFFSLYDRESAVLGGDLIIRDEVTLAPQQFLPISRPLNPDATYIGVVAAFRDIDHSQWRDLIHLNPLQNNNLQIEVGAANVSIRHH